MDRFFCTSDCNRKPFWEVV